MMDRFTPGLWCQECGHEYKTVAAAERASFEDGCPKCGSTDVDVCDPKVDLDEADDQADHMAGRSL